MSGWFAYLIKDGQPLAIVNGVTKEGCEDNARSLWLALSFKLASQDNNHAAG